MASNIMDLKSTQTSLPELLAKAKLELEKNDFVLSTKMRVVKKNGRVWSFIKSVLGIVLRNLEQTNHPLATARKLQILIDKRKVELSIEKEEHEKFKTDLKTILAKVLYIDPATNKVDEKIVKNRKKIASYQTVYSSILEKIDTAPVEGLELKIKQNDSELSKLKSKITKQEKEFNETKALCELNQKEIDDITVQIENLRNAKLETSKNAKDLKKTISNNEKKLKKLNNDLKKAEKKKESLKIYFDAVTTFKNKLQEEFQQFESKLKDLKEKKSKIENIKKEDEKKTNETEDSTAELLKKASENAEKATEDVEKATKRVEDLQAQLEKLSKDLVDTQENLKNSVGLFSDPKSVKEQLQLAKQEQEKALEKKKKEEEKLKALLTEKIPMPVGIPKIDLEKLTSFKSLQTKIETFSKLMRDTGRLLDEKEIVDLVKLIKDQKLNKETHKNLFQQLIDLALFQDDERLLLVNQIENQYLWIRLSFYPAPKIRKVLLDTISKKSSINTFSPLPILVTSNAPYTLEHIRFIVKQNKDLLFLATQGRTPAERAFEVGKSDLAFELLEGMKSEQEIDQLFKWIESDTHKEDQLKQFEVLQNNYPTVKWKKIFKIVENDDGSKELKISFKSNENNEMKKNLINETFSETVLKLFGFAFEMKADQQNSLKFCENTVDKYPNVRWKKVFKDWENEGSLDDNLNNFKKYIKDFKCKENSSESEGDSETDIEKTPRQDHFSDEENNLHRADSGVGTPDEPDTLDFFKDAVVVDKNNFFKETVEVVKNKKNRKGRSNSVNK